ncbi:hypothetical protein Vafri_19649 [Volvox africanus]|uniref:SET domain-containing protein n=1 Tax=Volvox africanus TaxID=51714 RepID=A0A8J4BPY5_9CHLO|nr:hypothetical protein Vafri_19649 [Volvox africanus]
MQVTKPGLGVLCKQFQSFVRPAGLVAALSRGAESAHSRAGYMPAIIGYPSIHHKVAALGSRAALPKANYQSRRTTAVAVANSSSSRNNHHHNSHNSSADTADSEGASGGVANPDGKRSSNVWPPPLEEWLRNHGGTVNSVELRSVLFPSGAVDRQLRATSDHPAGAILISVPRMLQIRYDNIEEAAAATAATSTDTAIPAVDAAKLVALYDMMPKGSDTGAAAWPFKQALTLLYHLSRGLASPLLPYIAHLPGIAPGVPTPRVAMLMHDDAVEELQYGNVIQDIRNQKYWLNHVTKEVFGRLSHGTEVPGASVSAAAAAAAAAAGRCGSASTPAALDPFGGLVVDAELFGWAVAVAMSRCFGLTRFRTHTCVPLVDMANHVAPYSASNCEIRTGPGGEVLMYAKRPIQADEELTLTYGTHDNHNLLLSYGFTLQPNPNDAFYFDIDLSTVESLVEGLMEDGSGRTGLASWQLQLLETHVGIGRADGGEYGKGSGSASGVSSGDNNSSSSNGAVRVYLSASLPSVDTAKESTCGDFTTPVEGDGTGADFGAEGVAEETTATTRASAAAVRSTVRQPVDPRLLAALRIATLQDETWYRILQPMSVDQIGGWANLLARQQEITVMRLLAALVTALYTTFPTTIQQDRQLLKAASVGGAATVAATSISPPLKPAHSSAVSFAVDNYSANTKAAVEGSVGCMGGEGGGGEWALRPFVERSMGGGGGAASNQPEAAIAAHIRDMAEAIRFRLGLKTTLERCLQALVARAKELDALQKIR